MEIDVTPANAEIRTSAGHACTGSCVINVPRKKEFTVTASARGYQTEIVDVDTRVSGKGAAGMAGNAIIGGVIGVGVDAVSGATLDHYPNPVIITLDPGTGTKKVFSDPPQKPVAEEPAGDEPVS